MRQSNSTTSEIITFISLNVLPSFFNLMPLSIWLATCLHLWELYQTKELEGLMLLGLEPYKLISTLTFSAILLSLFSFVGKEIIIYPIIHKAENYKLQKFKQGSDKKIFNQWLKSKENIFLNFDFLDLATNCGKNLTILKMSPLHQIEEKIESEEFYIEPNEQMITFIQGTLITTNYNSITILNNYKLKIPELFLHLQTVQGTSSLKQQILSIIVANNISSNYPLNQELGKFLSRILSHLQPILYILLTLCLFFIFQSKIRWIAIVIPYPFIVISTAIATFMLQHNYNALVVTFPYIIASLIIYVCIIKLKTSP